MQCLPMPSDHGDAKRGKAHGRVINEAADGVVAVHEMEVVENQKTVSAVETLNG
jgi:hypothetical protein